MRAMSCPECPVETHSPRARWGWPLVLAGSLGLGIAALAGASALPEAPRPYPEAASAASGVVEIEITDRGFSPSSVKLLPGTPTELEFLRTTEETCASSVVFPDLGVSEPLPLNEPVRVVVPPTERSSLSFQCGVGDHRSAIIVH